MLSYEETYAAIAGSVAARRSGRDVVAVAGPDAHSYLQGQCSQDLDPLQAGEVAEALLLSPQGKLVAPVRIVFDEDDDAIVVVAAGYGEAVLERLARFKIRVKATLSLERLACVELRGPDAPSVAGRLEVPGGAARAVLPVAFPGLVGLDVLAGELGLGGVPEGVEGAFEAARIEAGVPVLGRELTESTIPAEAGLLETTVSFTKGCYPGQELVARLEARGNNVPRRLHGLVLAGGGPASDTSGFAGAGVVVGAAEAGTVTSAAFSPGFGGIVGLCYLRRGSEVPAPCEVVGPDGQHTGEVRALPLR